MTPEEVQAAIKEALKPYATSRHVASQVASLGRSIANTASSIRQEMAGDWSTIEQQISLAAALVDSVLVEENLHVAAGTTITIRNPGPDPLRVAILCRTTNVGLLLVVDPGGVGTYTDPSDDYIELVSVSAFEATTS